MRRFVLERHIDVTGISGIGVVAEGLEFTDGTAVVRWRPVERDGTTVVPTTVVHESWSSVLALHGHGGNTELHWIDPPETVDPRLDRYRTPAPAAR
jgi:hypothetical protein